MNLSLSDILALSGRLTDQPGTDTARERFRRWLGNWPGPLADLQQLIEGGQRAHDDQSQRALLDLVVTIGRHLGCAVTYGVYDRHSGAVRFDGAWRSPGRARIVLEVRTERTRPFSPDDLGRTILALPDVDPPVPGERTIGVCIAVPLHGRRRVGDVPAAPGVPGGARQLPLHELLALAGSVVDQRVTHAQAVDALIRVGTDDVKAVQRAVEIAAVEPASAPPVASPRLSLVAREEPPDYWMATLLPEGTTTPAQYVDAVIRGRKVLGLRAVGIFPSTARPGDWVCFFVDREGVVGHARLGEALDPATAPLREAGHYAAIFALQELVLYDGARPIDPGSPAQRLASRVPFDATGPILSPLSQADFDALTRGSAVLRR